MAKAKNINGNKDGENGENQSYTIKGRGTVTRLQGVREVKQGKHEDCFVYTRDGKEYIRANPDSKTNNNIDK